MQHHQLQKCPLMIHNRQLSPAPIRCPVHLLQHRSVLYSCSQHLRSIPASRHQRALPPPCVVCTTETANTKQFSSEIHERPSANRQIYNLVCLRYHSRAIRSRTHLVPPSIANDAGARFKLTHIYSFPPRSLRSWWSAYVPHFLRWMTPHVQPALLHEHRCGRTYGPHLQYIGRKL